MDKSSLNHSLRLYDCPHDDFICSDNTNIGPLGVEVCTKYQHCRQLQCSTPAAWLKLECRPPVWVAGFCSFSPVTIPLSSCESASYTHSFTVTPPLNSRSAYLADQSRPVVFPLASVTNSRISVVDHSSNRWSNRRLHRKT